MVDFCADLLIKLYEPLVKDGIEALSIADPTASGDLINPKQMAKFAVPPLKKMSDWAKSKGAHTILHICGNTSDRLDLSRDGCSTIFFDQIGRISPRQKRRFPERCPSEAMLRRVHVLLNRQLLKFEAACRR